MKLQWMGEYRDFVEALIHYCNLYCTAYKPEAFEYKGVTYSFSIIQVLENVLEHEGENDNMSSIAQRLGITKSNFTKIVNRLESKGLISKVNKDESRKEISLVVTDLGKDLYENYSKMIVEYHFSAMFESLDNVPKEFVDMVAKGLRDANTRSLNAPNVGKKR